MKSPLVSGGKRDILVFHEDCTEEDLSYIDLPEEENYSGSTYTYSWKATTYKYQSNTLLFIDALIINTLYLFGAGLPIELIKTVTGWNRLHNLRSGIFSLSKTTVYIFLFVFPALVFWVLFEEATSKPAVQSLIKKIAFIALYYASRLAHTSKKFPAIFSALRLPPEDLKSVYAPVESEQEMKDELQSTTMRLGIDMSFLYYKFLQDKTDTSKLQKTIHNEVQGELTKVSGKVTMDASFDNLVETSRTLERKVFERNFLSTRTRLDEEYLYGYNLALHHLQKAFEEIKPSKLLPNLIGLINFIPPVLITIFFAGGNFGAFKDILFFFVFCVLNFGFAVWIIQILDQALVNLRRRVFLLEELEELISVSKQKAADTHHPNFLIFDTMTLRTWLNLRKIYMHYGERQTQAISAALGFILVFHLALVFMFLLEGLHVLHIYGDAYSQTLAIYAPSCFIYICFLIAFAYYGKELNEHFEHHIDILRKNKLVIGTVFDMYPNYIGERALQPKTYIANEGLKYIKKEFGENYSKHKAGKKSQELLEMHDMIIEALEVEEKEHPFRLMGFVMEEESFKVACVCMLPLILSLICSVLPEKFFEELPELLEFII